MKLIRLLFYKTRKFYARLLVLIIWTPVVWRKIKPSDGVIDLNSNFFHKHSVKYLNIARRRTDGWCLFKLFGVMVRDPFSRPIRTHFKYSDKHLFVVRKNKQ